MPNQGPHPDIEIAVWAVPRVDGNGWVATFLPFVAAIRTAGVLALLGLSKCSTPIWPGYIARTANLTPLKTSYDPWLHHPRADLLESSIGV
jgi:hypothetical protein